MSSTGASLLLCGHPPVDVAVIISLFVATSTSAVCCLACDFLFLLTT